MTAFLVMALIRVIDFSIKLYKIMVLFNFHGMFKCMLNIYIYIYIFLCFSGYLDVYGWDHLNFSSMMALQEVALEILL